MSERSHCFDGHFEGAPILPGVAHIALAVSAYAMTTGKPKILQGLRELRLKRPLGPGDEVEVGLTEDVNSASIRFEIRRRGESVSTGLLIFHPDDGGSLA